MSQQKNLGTSLKYNVDQTLRQITKKKSYIPYITIKHISKKIKPAVFLLSRHLSKSLHYSTNPQFPNRHNVGLKLEWSIFHDK